MPLWDDPWLLEASEPWHLQETCPRPDAYGIVCQFAATPSSPGDDNNWISARFVFCMCRAIFHESPSLFLLAGECVSEMNPAKEYVILQIHWHCVRIFCVNDICFNMYPKESFTIIIFPNNMKLYFVDIFTSCSLFSYSYLVIYWFWIWQLSIRLLKIIIHVHPKV